MTDQADSQSLALARRIMDMAEADKGLSLNTLAEEIERWWPAPAEPPTPEWLKDHDKAQKALNALNAFKVRHAETGVVPGFGASRMDDILKRKNVSRAQLIEKMKRERGGK